MIIILKVILSHLKNDSKIVLGGALLQKTVPFVNGFLIFDSSIRVCFSYFIYHQKSKFKILFIFIRPMLYEILDTILILGSAQGLIFSFIALYSKRLRSRSMIALILLILVLSLNNVQYYFLNSGMISSQSFFEIFYLPYTALIVALYYMYVLLFLFPDARISRKQRLLFVPFIIFLLVSLIFKVSSFFSISDENAYLYYERFVDFQEFFLVGFTLFVMVFVFRLISKYKHLRSREIKENGKNQLKWMKTITMTLLGLCLIWAVFSLMDLFFNSNHYEYYYILWVAIAITIYALGHLGLYHFGKLQYEQLTGKSNLKTVAEISKKTENKSDLIISFENLITENKRLTDSSLSLNDVASELDLNKSYLSRVINSELEISFSNYVNRLRIEEAKSCMSVPKFNHYSLISIGLEVGFNSKSAFNSAFKKFTGLTPSEYREKLNSEQILSK